jgi:poly(A) polymerase
MREAHRDLALDVVRQLRESGHVALWAGGCVRDLLLGLEPSDYDVATDARPEEVMRLFPRTIPVGVSFGVVRVLGRPRGNEVEVATFRSDDAYVDGRRPTSVSFSTPEVDASRRDFTINGLFFDPVDQQVLDYVGGRVDLEARVLRAIGDPMARFDEDKLRLLRAIRFAARFGLTIDPATLEAIRIMATQVRVVSAERIAQELRKILVHPSRVRAVEMLRETGLLVEIVPDVARMAEADAGVWASTLRTLEELGGGAPPGFPLVLAALTHDVAMGDGVGGEEDHAQVGAQRVDALGRRLKLSNPEREEAAWLVAHHHALDGAPALAPHRIKRLLAHPWAGPLIRLVRAVQVARIGSSPDADACEAYLGSLPDGPLDPAPLIDGRDILARGVRPGPRVAVLLECLRDAQLDGVIRTRAEAIDHLQQLIHSPA